MNKTTLLPGWREAIKQVIEMPVGAFIPTKTIEIWFDAAEESKEYRFQWMQFSPRLRSEHGICLTRVRANGITGKSGYTIATAEEKVQIHNERWKERMKSTIRGWLEVIDSIDPSELSEDSRRKLEHDTLYAGRMLQAQVRGAGKSLPSGKIE